MTDRLVRGVDESLVRALRQPAGGHGHSGAAIALLHDLTFVTRNTADFCSTGVRPLSPFKEP